MTPPENAPNNNASVEEVQKGWHELGSRVGQLEAERVALEQENKSLRFLLERVIEHREKSHGELVQIMAGLVSKLPINDVGVVVSRLIEHNARVCEVCAALTKGTVLNELPQPAAIKALDQTKRELVAALKPAIEELAQFDPPLEPDFLKNLAAKPDSFFEPAVARANRCYLKGQIARERVVKEFGEESLIFFNDLTTDPKLNPRPKPEEIVLAFKPDFDALFAQYQNVLHSEHRPMLAALHQKVQRSKAPTEQSRLERCAFQKLAFILELLHYYESPGTEAPDVVFAQRLPALVEQLALSGPQDKLEEKALTQVEALLSFVIQADHRLMIVNNLGKGGGSFRTLKYVLRLRVEKTPDQHELASQFVKHLLPPSDPTPPPQALAPIFKLIHPQMQTVMIGAIISYDKMRRDDAETLARAIAKELGISMREEAKATALSPEIERQLAWEKIKELLANRGNPAAVAAAVRERLHAKYDADEIKQSWITLTEADAMSFIRVFCHLPYLPDGTTDGVARAVMETYVSRLMHEKYAASYAKVMNSLKNMFRIKQDSPTLVNFVALVRWIDPEAANRMGADIGMAPAPVG